MNTKVAILGAGCSCYNGYPLANQMKDHLKDFAKHIEVSAPRLHKMAQNTLALFDKLAEQGCRAQTIDDVAWLVHQGKMPTMRGTFQDDHDYHGIPDPMKAVPITDDEFIFDNRHGIYSNSPKPSLIVFPHEKDHLKEYPGNILPFRFYIPEIWRAAREFMAKADEVWIIGYSVPEADWPPLEPLLK